MTDPAEPDPSAALASLVAEVLEQAPRLAGLDGPRAEVWASDVLALAAEIDPDRGPSELLAVLTASTDAGAGVARAALSAFREVEVGDADPPWRPVLRTSRCDRAWLLSSGAARSAAFHFTDAAESAHVVTVDLVPGRPETVGEVAVGPGGLLDVLAEEDARITAEDAAPSPLAERVARAIAATRHPHESLVAAGRLLALRLGTLTDEPVPVPVAIDEEVPPPPTRDPEDDAHALGVLGRALGAPPTVADADAAVSAVAEMVAPRDLAPFAPAERDAIAILEWADWLGAVIGVVRAGPGAPMGGDDLVDAVNRCPEVTTTIPKADRGRVAWAFEVLTASWADLGLVVDGRLTELGAAVLPAGLARAWGPDPVAG